MPEQSISTLQSQLNAGKTSAQDIAADALARADDARDLNIFITETPQLARERARQSDERISSGTARALEGIPFAVKDNYCTDGIRTTAASNILTDFVPRYESRVTALLQEAGAVMVGKTNLDEFAMGSSTENSAFGPTKNPAGSRLGFDNLVAGGSSGGSAAAVAAGIVPFALGTDTGGSVRQPASFCGIVGFKPTYGVCSRWGIIAYGSSLDQTGVFAKNVGDVATVMDVVAGDDPRDATSCWNREYHFADVASRAPADLSGVRVGFPIELEKAGENESVARVWAEARRRVALLNGEAVQVSLPHITAALPAYYIVALAEASSNLARYDGIRYGNRVEGISDIAQSYERTRSEGFGAEVKRRILMGTFVLSSGYYDAYFMKASKVRNLVAQDFSRASVQCDVIAMPTTAGSAFAIGAHGDDPVSMYLEDLYTTPVNMAGLPALSLPVTSCNDGMPLGLQLIGQRFCDERLLELAATIERATNQ